MIAQGKIKLDTESHSIDLSVEKNCVEIQYSVDAIPVYAEIILARSYNSYPIDFDYNQII